MEIKYLSKSELIWIIDQLNPDNLDELMEKLTEENAKRRKDELARLSDALTAAAKEYSDLCSQYNSKNPFDAPVSVLKRKTDLMNEMNTIEARIEYLTRGRV